MPRRKGVNGLDVYLGTSRVGVLRRGTAGDVAFAYDRDWMARDGAIPVSLSLPFQDRPHLGAKVAAFFDNLLPDAETVRRRIAEREGAASDRPFDLLAAIGRDCVGALRFLPEGADPGEARAHASVPIDDAGIARRLRNLGAAPLGREAEDADFRISIAGAQDKTAFYRAPGGGWHIPLDATPTSHIFKPPIGTTAGSLDLSDSVENEWLGLALCEALGLPTARAEIARFEDVKALVVERFDRIEAGGLLRRLHQEDLCQALGVPSTRKYEENGGPGLLDVLAFLRRSNQPDRDVPTFLRAQMVYWLIAAPDGHAKNFSIHLTPGGGFRLTPVYDVMTSAPYAATHEAFHPRRIKLAMAVGKNRHYRVGDITGRHWLQTCEQARIDPRIARRNLEELADRMDEALDAVAARLPPDFPPRMFDAAAAALRARRAALVAPAD